MCPHSGIGYNVIISGTNAQTALIRMNPFTNYLRQWSADNDLASFIDDWDRLERIVIGVYRKQITPDSANDEFERVWPRLRARYPQHQPGLSTYWPKTKAAGEPTQTDPFELLLSLPNPQAITGNWQAMQYLPAAREALNQYLVEHGPPAHSK